MVLGSFSITSVRSQVIDYSAPFYHSGFALMSINRKSTDTKWFSYLDPYPPSVWAMIIAMACVAAMFLVSVMICLNSLTILLFGKLTSCSPCNGAATICAHILDKFTEEMCILT